MSVKSLLAKSFYAVPRSNAIYTDNIADGLLVRSDTAAKTGSGSPTITRLDSVGVVDTQALGVKKTHVFKLAVPDSVVLGGYVRVRCKWDIVASAPAGTIGRVNLDMKHNGAAIPSLSKFSGKPRALDAAPATVYIEQWMVLVPPTTETFRAGDTIDIVIEFEVTKEDAAANILQWGLHCNPAVAGNEIVVEFDQGAD